MSSKSFAYDAMGNRTGSSNASTVDTVATIYTPNRLNRYAGLTSSWAGGASGSESTLGYDKSGNLTNWTSVATGACSASNTVYVYDDADRLTSVVTRNPSTLANVGKSEFQYDGLSRLRVTKEYTWNGTAWVIVAGSEKRRVYDGMDVVQERDGSNGVGSTYTRDGNIGGILAKRSGTTSSYFHYDGSGNVVGLTDSTQASVAEYSYDAFGNTLSSSGAQASSNTYRYSTKEYFGSVGLYNYGYRFYSPGMGRWINRDPVEEDGGLNLYAFNYNSPTNYVDPDGETPAAIAIPAAGTIIGGGAAVPGPGTVIAVGTIGVIAAYSVGDAIARRIYPDEMELPAPPRIYPSSEHTKRSGSKRRTNDKHTKPRPGGPEKKDDNMPMPTPKKAGQPSVKPQPKAPKKPMPNKGPKVKGLFPFAPPSEDDC